MNKLVKGSIAGAAGIALLLGGAGTLALWNADADIVNESIDSGTLTLTASTGTWTGDTDNALWVPGDSATYNSTLTIGATGDNLEATLSVDTSSIAAGDLADALVIEIAVTGVLPGGVTDNGDGTYDITEAADGASLPVTVTVTFPSTVGDAPQAGDRAQADSVDLSGLAFLLQQHL